MLEQQRLKDLQRQLNNKNPRSSNPSDFNSQNNLSQELERMKQEMKKLSSFNKEKEEQALARKDIDTLNHCKIKLFNGEDNIDAWWRKVDGFMSINIHVFSRINESQKVGFIKSLLTEDVHMLIDRDQNLRTLEEIKSKLLQTYASQDDWPRKLFFARQEERESVKDFLKRVR